LRDNITLKYYDAGHMMYLYEPALAELSKTWRASSRIRARDGEDRRLELSQRGGRRSAMASMSNVTASATRTVPPGPPR